MPDLFDTPARPYPEGPGYSDDDTSRAAAASVEPHTSRIAGMVLERLRLAQTADTVGFTADQLEQALGLRAQTVTGRLRELVLAGKVIDSGERRPTRRGRMAKVWSLAPPGTQAPELRRDVERQEAVGLYRALHTIPAGWRITSLGQRHASGDWRCWLMTAADDQEAKGRGPTMLAAIKAASDAAAAKAAA